MNTLMIKNKVKTSVKEKLKYLYSANNIKFIEYDEDYLILENTFLVFISEDLNCKMSTASVFKRFLFMTKKAEELNLKQFIIVSNDGFECNKDFYAKFNVRLEDYNYLEELERYAPCYTELLCHNRIATKYIRSKFSKGNNRACIIQPTGTGKSYIIESILKDYPDTEKVVLAPNKYILGQLKETILNNKGSLDKIEFLTYSKLSMMSEEDLEYLNPKIIVLDEIHRVGANVWGSKVNELLNMNSNSNVLGVTATPIREADGYRDMSYELFGDNVLVNLDLIEAMGRGILPIPQYVTACYEIEGEINNLSGAIEKSSMTLEEKEAIYEDIRKFKSSWNNFHYISNILAKYIKDDMNKFLVFCKNKEHLEEMVVLVKKWFEEGLPNRKVNCQVISSFHSKAHCDRALESFKKKKRDSSSIDLLFSINKLNEGIHIEIDEEDIFDDIGHVDGIILTRATESKIIYFQQLGRVMSATNSKSPLVLDLVNNINIVNCIKFKESIYNKINNVKKEFRDLSENSFFFDNLNRLKINIIDETKDLRYFVEKNSQLVSRDWNAMYNKLVIFKNQYGHTNVPKKDDDLDNKFKGLGSWVSYNRCKYLNNTLEPDKIEKLNKLGFVWNLLDAIWFENYNKLVEYKQKYGDCLVPFSNKEYIDLANWLSRQANAKKQGRLLENRFKLLDDLGVVWQRSKDVSFDDRIKEYKSYMKTYNTNKIIQNEENKSLYEWVIRMRKYKKRDKLSEEQINALNNINFCWDAKEEVWLESFNILKIHIDKFGTTKIQSNMPYYNKITIWLAKQRKYNDEGKLEPKRLEMLKNIGIDLNIK